MKQSDISGPEANSKLGIQCRFFSTSQPSDLRKRHNNVLTSRITRLTCTPAAAKKTITGRGVLLDWASWASSNSIPYDPFASVPHNIPLADLLAVAAAQAVVFRPSDILFIRTGWLAAFNTLSTADKALLPHRPTRSSIGVEASEEMIEWHWNSGFAAVASDTVAYEAWPSPRENRFGVSLHEVLLSGWGCPIGESFDLERLAERRREERRWSFFFCSVPLNVEGGGGRVHRVPWR